MDDAVTSPSARRTVRLWVAVYLIASFGTALLAKFGPLPPWLGLALFLSSFLLLLPMVRAVERAQKECGTGSKAMRAYNRRVLTASFIYVAALFAGVAFARYYAPPASVRILLALMVSLPVLAIIRAMALLLKEESDEYLRMRIVNQSLIATGFLLVAATLYGFLNAFDLAPRIDAYFAVPVWALGLGVGALLQRKS